MRQVRAVRSRSLAVGHVRGEVRALLAPSSMIRAAIPTSHSIPGRNPTPPRNMTHALPTRCNPHLSSALPYEPQPLLSHTSENTREPGPPSSALMGQWLAERRTASGAPGCPSCQIAGQAGAGALQPITPESPGPVNLPRRSMS